MLTITARLGFILTALRHAVAAFAAQQDRARSLVWLGAVAYAPIIPPNQPSRIPTQTWVLLYNRLGRTAARFTALFARWSAGTLPTPRPARAPRPVAAPSPIPRLPSAHGWVNVRIADSAPCTGQLEALLHDPELPKFLAAAPQAGRLLRPLCRALGLPEPSWLKRPAQPKPQRLPLRPPRAELESPPPTPDRPLPPYIRAAVRAWKKFDK